MCYLVKVHVYSVILVEIVLGIIQHVFLALLLSYQGCQPSVRTNVTAMQLELQPIRLPWWSMVVLGDEDLTKLIRVLQPIWPKPLSSTLFRRVLCLDQVEITRSPMKIPWNLNFFPPLLVSTKTDLASWKSNLIQSLDAFGWWQDLCFATNGDRIKSSWTQTQLDPTCVHP